MSEEDEEMYDFEYSDEDMDGYDEEEDSIVIQSNTYYETKDLLEDREDEAVKRFETLLAEEASSETGRTEWGFRALKQLVKLHFRAGRFREMLEAYRRLLDYVIDASVTRNQGEKAINSLLEYVSAAPDVSVPPDLRLSRAASSFGILRRTASTDSTTSASSSSANGSKSNGEGSDEVADRPPADISYILQHFYKITLDVLEKANNDRLWIKTNLKLGNWHFHRGEYTKLARIVKSVRQKMEERDDDMFLLELLALQIQMYTAQKNNKELKDLYHRCIKVKKTGVLHPLNMGVIYECGGKMYLAEGDVEKASGDFYQAFLHFDEAGSPHRIVCLKYVILASMLQLAEIDPLSGVEAQPYRKHEEIAPLLELADAFQKRGEGMVRFENVMRKHEHKIMSDPLFAQYFGKVVAAVRKQVLCDLVKPYTRVRIPYISEELHIPAPAVEDLLVSLILDKELEGRIDQMNQILILRPPTNVSRSRTHMYENIDRWNQSLETVSKNVTSKFF
eukprot:CAMPEP_0177645646 /NCGR_PEP_ID=MMETSP0447-20121125/9358_1 /TAXON_ID=0 /ORGANISM="Stygamoeba regulata, Strain BSH-02190019" /LENGTH=505 /DNA_ID=CAMNT_0019148139 /DNA_START=1168 /DNA_END=2685 /DNA_ORIENTATION=+